jgi:hypothetical protein
MSEGDGDGDGALALALGEARRLEPSAGGREHPAPATAARIARLAVPRERADVPSRVRGISARITLGAARALP